MVTFCETFIGGGSMLARYITNNTWLMIFLESQPWTPTSLHRPRWVKQITPLQKYMYFLSGYRPVDSKATLVIFKHQLLVFNWPFCRIAENQHVQVTVTVHCAAAWQITTQLQQDSNLPCINTPGDIHLLLGCDLLQTSEIL